MMQLAAERLLPEPQIRHGLPHNYPFCEVCQRPVDCIEFEYRLETVCGWEDGGVLHYYHTGEIIVTVRCHGETFRMSNTRGRLRMNGDIEFTIKVVPTKPIQFDFERDGPQIEEARRRRAGASCYLGLPEDIALLIFDAEPDVVRLSLLMKQKLGADLEIRTPGYRLPEHVLTGVACRVPWRVVNSSEI